MNVLGPSLVALAAAVGPPAPADAVDGDFVEVDGVVYQAKGGVLYTLDDDAVADLAAEVTVTGSRLDKNRKQKVVRAEVVDGDAIRESGARTLADVLEEQGGVQVNSSLGLGAEVFVDGLDGRHVLILVDGRPVNGKVNNRVDVSRLPVDPSSIERIEIVRGPMSALYGSEALGGVINIITKKPTAEVGGSVDVGGQLLVATATPWGSVGLHGHGGLGPFALRLDVQGQQFAGYDRGGVDGKDVPDGKADVPDRRQGSLNVDATAPLPAGFVLRSTLTSTLSQTSAVVSAAAPFRDAADNHETAVSVAVDGDVDVGLADALTLHADLRVDRFTHQFKKLPQGDSDTPPAFCATAFFDPACPAAPNVRTDARKDEARAEVRADAVFVDDPDATTWLGRELSLSLGAVALHEVAVRKNDEGEDTLPGGGDRVTGSVYGEALWRPLQHLAILPGVRADAFVIDDSADATVALAPKLAARLDVPVRRGGALNVRASVGRGFRLPSFEERFLRFDHSELGYIVEGNAGLAPESSTGVRAELGYVDDDIVPVDVEFGGAALDVPVDVGVEFGANLIDNLITEASDGASADGIPVFTYKNAARAWTAALTTRARVGPVAVSDLAFRLDATWQYLLNAVDASACPDDDPFLCAEATSLPLRPAHSVDVTGRVTLVPTGSVLFVRTDALSERPLITETAPGAVVFSFGVRQPVTIASQERAEVVVAVENVFDAGDPVFGPKPGRHLTFNLRVWQ